MTLICGQVALHSTVVSEIQATRVVSRQLQKYSVKRMVVMGYCLEFRVSLSFSIEREDY